MDDDVGSNHAILTVATGLTPDSINMESNTTMNINLTYTFSIDPTTAIASHTINTVNISGSFVYSPTTTGSQTLNIIGNVTVNSGGDFTSLPTVSGITFNISDNKQLICNDSTAVINIQGSSWVNRVTITAQGLPANGGNILINTSSSSTHFKLCSI